MKRLTFAAMATGVVACLPDNPASAQVYIRAPFVRVQVGGPGVYVRAPFVNLAVPSVSYTSPPVFVGPPPAPQAPQGELLPAPDKAAPDKPAPDKPAPPPPAKGKFAPPLPMQPEASPSLEEFAKGFQPKAGSYEVTLLNPVTRQPTLVRFTLPEGTPRRVNTSRSGIEFDYGPRRYVRIQFDRDGAEIVTRGQ